MTPYDGTLTVASSASSLNRAIRSHPAATQLEDLDHAVTRGNDPVLPSPRREVFGRLADEIVGSIRGQHLDHDRRYVVTTSPVGALLSTARLLYPCGLTRSGSPVSAGRKLALARN